jgi:hypothetical protein
MALRFLDAKEQRVTSSGETNRQRWVRDGMPYMCIRPFYVCGVPMTEVSRALLELSKLRLHAAHATPRSGDRALPAVSGQGTASGRPICLSRAKRAPAAPRPIPTAVIRLFSRDPRTVERSNLARRPNDRSVTRKDLT